MKPPAITRLDQHRESSPKHCSKEIPMTNAIVRRCARTLAIVAVATAAALVPAVTMRAEGGSTPNQRIAGIGEFTLNDVNVTGHPIRFAIHANTDAAGTPRGSFRFRHLLPDGSVLATGHADVTCLQVVGDTALLTAVVTEEQIAGAEHLGDLPLGPHAFYVKIIDGGRDDKIVFTQAIGPPPDVPLRQDCLDVEEQFPGELKRYPIERGNYTIRDAAAPAGTWRP
jgi:hypothetical protein